MVRLMRWKQTCRFVLVWWLLRIVRKHWKIPDEWWYHGLSERGRHSQHCVEDRSEMCAKSPALYRSYCVENSSGSSLVRECWCSGAADSRQKCWVVTRREERQTRHRIFTIHWFLNVSYLSFAIAAALLAKADFALSYSFSPSPTVSCR